MMEPKLMAPTDDPAEDGATEFLATNVTGGGDSPPLVPPPGGLDVVEVDGVPELGVPEPGVPELGVPEPGFPEPGFAGPVAVALFVAPVDVEPDELLACAVNPVAELPEKVCVAAAPFTSTLTVEDGVSIEGGVRTVILIAVGVLPLVIPKLRALYTPPF